jgi:rhodanese-related sulfurtransferase
MCPAKEPVHPKRARAEIQLSPADLAEMLRRGAVQVIDLRGDEDPGAGAIQGARAMTLRTLAHEGMTLDRERPVAFCGSGAIEAAELLRDEGYTAYAVTGDLAAWREVGLPIDDEPSSRRAEN